MFHCCDMKKLNLILKLKLAIAQRINLTFVLYGLVAYFLSYISAKYYLNWFSFHIVIVKVTGVNFFLKHSVYIVFQLECLVKRACQLPQVTHNNIFNLADRKGSNLFVMCMLTHCINKVRTYRCVSKRSAIASF